MKKVRNIMLCRNLWSFPRIDLEKGVTNKTNPGHDANSLMMEYVPTILPLRKLSCKQSLFQNVLEEMGLNT